MSADRFNPRTHEGCDMVYDASDIEYAVSIHAPMKGATIVLYSHDTYYVGFLFSENFYRPFLVRETRYI